MMSQILVPIFDLTVKDFDDKTFKNQDHNFGYKKGLSPTATNKWSYIDELPGHVNNTLDFIRSDFYHLLEPEGSTSAVRMGFRLGTKTGVLVRTPISLDGYELQVYHCGSQGNGRNRPRMSQIALLQGGIDEDVGSFEDATLIFSPLFGTDQVELLFPELNDPRRMPPYYYAGDLIGTVYPDFAMFTIRVPSEIPDFAGTTELSEVIAEIGPGTSAITNHNNLWLFIEYFFEPMTDDGEQLEEIDDNAFVAVTAAHLSLPDSKLTIEDKRLNRTPEDQRSIMKAIAANDLVRFRDEQITWDFTTHSPKGTDLGLLRKVSGFSLKDGKWSILDLQIMSGSIDFLSNTLKVRATNDIHKEIGYKEIIERERLRQEQEKLGDLWKKVNNRVTSAKRMQPYEDNVTVNGGGGNANLKSINAASADGNTVQDDQEAHPVRTGVM